MKEWIITVTVCCVILSVLGSLLSEGKTKKYIFGILKLVALIMICIPVISFFSEKKSYDSQMYETSQMNNEVQKDFLCTLSENELTKKGIECRVIKTIIDNETYIDIFLNETVINEQEGNIYKNSKTVTEIVKKYLNVDKDHVRIWSK